MDSNVTFLECIIGKGENENYNKVLHVAITKESSEFANLEIGDYFAITYTFILKIRIIECVIGFL